MFELTRDQDLFILTMRNGENRFNLETLAALHAKLDEVEAQAGDGPGALIVTGEGKFWSNGIDLDWWQAAPEADSARFVPTLNAFLGRVLAFPLPTVAALNGHTFAGGGLLALAMDWRVMREDRGWFCLPEVDINIPFHPAMMALNKCKLGPATLRDAVLSGRRYVAPEAMAAGIVDAMAPEAELLAKAGELAAPMAKKGRKILSRMKRDLYGDVADMLCAEQ